MIRRFLWETRDVVKNPEESKKWLEQFRNTLQYQDLEEAPNEYALLLLAESRSFNNMQLRKQQMRWVRESLKKEGITNPTQEQLDEKWLEMYGQETTADGDTREDSQDVRDGSNSGILESGTSANLYGAATTREGVDASTTGSNNMRRVPQNEAPAHGFSGGRTAQGTMSRSPEAAAQSGKAYDQETDQASTNGPRQAEARQSQRAGGNSVRRVAKVSTPPVRSVGPMPEDKQEVYDYASLEGLDKDDAYECWYVTTTERNGLTADGKEIKNWKAYVKQWCRTRKSKREENGHGSKKD